MAVDMLPPVVTRLAMTLDDFRDGIAEAKALLKTLNGLVEIKVDVDDDLAKSKLVALAEMVIALDNADPAIKVDAETATAITALETLKDSIESLAAYEYALEQQAVTTAMALGRQRDAMAEKGVATASLSRRTNTLTARELDLAAAAKAAAEELRDQSAAILANAAISDAARANTATRATQNTGWNVNWFGIPINGTTLHWIISGGSEILAVLLPALVGLGAASAAAIEGLTNIGTHLESVYTATEATNQMFGETAGNLIGLKSYLQQAQDAADPKIYGILGSAVLTVKEHFGDLAQTGTQVIGVMQTFAAKVVTDFQPGSVLSNSMDSFLAHTVSDVTDFGKFFGNLGNALMVFGTQMPGLAELLLKGLANITGWIAELVDLSSKFQVNGVSVITAAMAYEEFNRWGGLAVGLLSRMGIAERSDLMDSMVLSWSHFVGVLESVASILPGVLGLLARSPLGDIPIGLSVVNGLPMIQRLGDALEGAEASAAGLISTLATTAGGLPLVGIAAAAVAVGVLIDKLVTAQSAAQKLGSAMQTAVMQSSNSQALMTTAANIGVLTRQIQAASAAVDQQQAKAANSTAVNSTGIVSFLKGLLNPVDLFGNPLNGYQQSADSLKEYQAALKQQQQDQNNVLQGAQWIEKQFGVDLPAALAIADNANVKLASGILGNGKAMTLQQAQILSLVQGYRSMGQAAGEVGADMTALAIQSGLEGTQVSKLNSAWDDFLSNLSGGTDNLGTFVSDMRTVGNITETAVSKIQAFSQGGSGNGVALTTSQIANGLKSLTSATGSQLWMNFDSVLSQGEQLTDWLRTAGAEGAIGSGQFTNAILGLVSSLMPLASQSKTAQAELLGLVQEADPSIKTWEQLNTAVKADGVSLNTTANAVSQATIKMGDMAQVAENLGNVLNSDVLNSLSATVYQASGAGQAMTNYANAIQKSGANSSAAQSAYNALLKDLEGLGYSASQAKQFIQLLQGQIDQLHGKTVAVNVVTNSSALTNLPSSSAPRVGVSSAAALHAAGIHGFASGTSGASKGWAWVGEAGPELVKFSGGERVIPNHIARGYASGTGYDDTVHEIHVHLDGREIYKGVKKEAVNTQRRTGSNGLTKRYR